ncbi:uncharacterized protein LOC108845055 [Raphanus sativus]|uniref:Uncharacterized protein LOC108845055 n=1 Tax=Raphanus sativus TaxID=3726 RepID=A0A9W3DEG9_RAPSA|nr:uncharacterized protein LOC108845055 [Raphanus sativus]
MEVQRKKLRVDAEDVNICRCGSGYKQKFSIHDTWWLLRSTREKCSWSRSIWFPGATPKFAFVAWLAASNRLSTMNRITQWDPGAVATCVLCKREPETKNLLFFECSFSSQVWEYLTKGILLSDYTNVWANILEVISDESIEEKKRFCLRYALQSALHVIWRERNKIKHEEKPMLVGAVMKMVEKGKW